MSYAFDNAWRRSRQRLTTLETWLDPGTIRHLEMLGVAPGWRCLEVGAGGGSIAAWLGKRVDPGGYVLATDIDTRFLEALDAPNIEVRRHDIADDPLATDAFDLIHLRLVLAHLSAREQVLRRLAAALRPGGWLLVEEMDFASIVPDPTGDSETAALLTEAVAAHNRVMSAHGFDTSYGRRLASDLRAQGLEAVDAEGRLTSCRGGSPPAGAWQLTFEQLAAEIIADGAISREDLTALLQRLDDPSIGFLSQTMLAAWGRRPTA